MISLGINLGACCSSAAFVKDGTLHYVKAPGRSLHSWPSAAFVDETGKIIVGHNAEMKRKSRPDCFRNEFKRDLGDATPYRMRGRTVFPQEIAAAFMDRLRAEAEKMSGEAGVKSAVIAIPVNFGGLKKDLLVKAAADAGIPEVSFVFEPIAAAEYYDKKKSAADSFEADGVTLIYDLGGGTFDAALVKRRDGLIALEGEPLGLSRCGGADFDRLIVEDIVRKCGADLRRHFESGGDESQRAMIDVLNAASSVKHQLSGAEDGEAFLDLPAAGVAMAYKLHDSDFNSLARPLLEETLEVCGALLSANHLSWNSIGAIALVGGSCRLPLVAHMLKQASGRPVLCVDYPELAICSGAALRAQAAATGKDSTVAQNCRSQDTGFASATPHHLNNPNKAFF